MQFQPGNFGVHLRFGAGRKRINLCGSAGGRAARIVKHAIGILRYRPKVRNGGAIEFLELGRKRQVAVTADGKILRGSASELGLFGLFPNVRIDSGQE